MTVEKLIAGQIAASAGETVSRLGLRFDCVATRVLGDLRRFAKGRAPAGTTILLALSAPIRTPAKTVTALQQEIETLLRTAIRRRDRSTVVCGNAVRLRLVERAATGARPLVGLVHNHGIDSSYLLEIAERWLRA
jgi:hypothetical protein